MPARWAQRQSLPVLARRSNASKSKRCCRSAARAGGLREDSCSRLRTAACAGIFVRAHKGFNVQYADAFIANRYFAGNVCRSRFRLGPDFTRDQFTFAINRDCTHLRYFAELSSCDQVKPVRERTLSRKRARSEERRVGKECRAR